ncbi:hypothetical protein OS493_029805 [Desmophyllum pertusum]|uniref:SH3 domain-containing protein n=1 Tax=Desmophyllum pertusum TaxID=174260 RepID=A0A9W9YJX1_9CNID|nr:hypothetical protein OS493_029805 [Desmophyllum pertusum]
MASKTRTYGRGILRFTSLEPCRRPGQTNNGGPNNLNGVHEEPVDNSRVQNGGDQTHVQITTDTGTAEKVPTQKGDKPVKLLAKYNYKANPTKPGGFDELTVTQGEKLELCNAHPSNPHWWEARNENGDVGFVPSSYMMVLEDKISALPWLADQIQEVKQEEEERPVGKFGVGAPAFKPYVSGSVAGGRRITIEVQSSRENGLLHHCPYDGNKKCWRLLIEQEDERGAVDECREPRIPPPDYKLPPEKTRLLTSRDSRTQTSDARQFPRGKRASETHLSDPIPLNPTNRGYSHLLRKGLGGEGNWDRRGR